MSGAPVVGTYSPGVAKYVKEVLALTNQNSLPDDEYELIAVVQGIASVPGVQRPGAATVPAGQPNPTDVACRHPMWPARYRRDSRRAPVAVGTPVPPVPER